MSAIAAFRTFPLPGDQAMLTLGEVHTGLLQNSVAVSQQDTGRMLTLLLGERVRRWERPIAHAVSPQLLTGLDCRLPTLSGSKCRVVGTAASRATITGGHVLQGSSFCRVVAGESSRRLPWSHYLSRPGTVEVIGRYDRDDLVSGFVSTQPAGQPAGQPATRPAGRSAGVLDLGAISGRVMDSVQQATGLDHRPPFRVPRTWLRWAATESDPAQAAVRFTLEDDRLRTVRLRAPVSQPDRIAELAEDLALHDWLLSTLLRIVERSRIGADGGAQAVERLRPAIDHLLHLWLPAARLDEALAGMWDSLERRPGFSRQWNLSVARIRDQVAVSTLSLFGSVVGDARPA